MGIYWCCCLQYLFLFIGFFFDFKTLARVDKYAATPKYFKACASWTYRVQRVCRVTKTRLCVYKTHVLYWCWNLHHVHLTAFLSIHIKAKVYFGLKVFPLALQTLKMRRFSHMKKWHYITSQPIASGPLLSSAHQPVGKMSSDKDSSPVNRTGLLALFHVSIRKHTVYQPVLLSNVLSNKLSLPQTPHEVVAISRRMAAIITSCPVRPLRWTLRQGSS